MKCIIYLHNFRIKNTNILIESQIDYMCSNHKETQLYLTLKKLVNLVNTY